VGTIVSWKQLIPRTRQRRSSHDDIAIAVRATTLILPMAALPADQQVDDQAQDHA
jgi:hypothetical protein